MTEKRFYLLNYNNYPIYDSLNNEEYNAQFKAQRKKLCLLLNELHEENEQLKQRNKRLEYKIQRERNSTYKQYAKWEKEAETKIKELSEKNEWLKQELKVYRKVASCSNCKYHNYDWDINDGYGGEEYEVCDKGNDVTDGICEEWEEL